MTNPRQALTDEEAAAAFQRTMPGWQIDPIGKPFRSELTPAGEQLVIPGCEQDQAPGVKQMDLF